MIPTVRHARARAVERLAEAGVDTPRLDAELLLAHVLRRNRTFILAHPDEPLSAAQQDELEGLLRRRSAREPLPYLLGSWEFMGLPFLVTPAVLIPRPETEILVEAAAGLLEPGARILDVGAGSGCVGIALARAVSGARVAAMEPSPAAAAVARQNALALGVADRVEVVEASFPAGAETLRDLDAVVSNPPYIPTAEVEELAPELRLYEPRQALDGGPDGLALIRPLVDRSPRLLRPGGLLALEVARGQAESVAALLRDFRKWQNPTTIPDLAGVPRVLLARRAP